MQNILALFALVALLLPFSAQAQGTDPRAETTHIEYLRMTPDLIAAEGHEDFIESVYDRFEIWSYMAKALEPLDFRLTKDLLEGETLLNRALTYAVQKNSEDCTTNLAHAEKIIHWVNFTLKHSALLSGSLDFQLGMYKYHALRCVKLELQLDSVMLVTGHSANARMVVRAKIPLTSVATDKSITLTGTGVLEYVSAQMPTGHGCTVQTQPISGTITVTAAEFQWTDVAPFKQALEIKSLTLNLTQLSEIETVTCPTSSGKMTLNAWSGFWNGFHHTEGLGNTGSFVLADWKSGSGRNFSTKEYKQDRHSAMFEETTISLVRSQ